MNKKQRPVMPSSVTVKRLGERLILKCLTQELDKVWLLLKEVRPPRRRAFAVKFIATMGKRFGYTPEEIALGVAILEALYPPKAPSEQPTKRAKR